VTISVEEREYVATIAAFVDRDVRPVARDLEHDNTFPADLIERMRELGVFGLEVPETYGGSPVSTPCYALVAAELARGWMSLAGAMGPHSVVCSLLVSFGTDEQKTRYLPRLATGEIRAAMALTEPGGGSDLQNMRTVARRQTDGSYLINGGKTWITNGRRAGLIALLCKTNPDASPSHRGVSLILVEHGPGLVVSRDLPKLGYKGVESCELAFDGYVAAPDALLGGVEGHGFAGTCSPRWRQSSKPLGS
jgi:alkylation response protein AidB-like acyl-CoA dehydrogenase